MTPEEVRKILDTAADLTFLERWDDILELLRPLEDSGQLSGEDAGEAAYYIGLACQAQGAWDAAGSYFDVALQKGSAAMKTEAKAALDELARKDTATEAAGDGVTQADAAAILRAANDAMAGNDLESAMGYYRQVYDGTVDDKPKFEATLGIARVHAYRTELGDAEDYANYVKSEGPEDLRVEAGELLTWISEQRTAAQATADGVAADEFTQATKAALDLFAAGRYAQALPLFMRVYESEHVPGIARARAAFNAGSCHISLDDDAAARPLLEYAREHGPADLTEDAKAMLEVIDDIAAAQRLVQQLGASAGD